MKHFERSNVSIPNRDFIELQFDAAGELHQARTVVSIPNRDFIELQLNKNDHRTFIAAVSIPNRDFIELQFLHLHLHLHQILFQSLIGILLNCNHFFTIKSAKDLSFQSLIGILLNCNQTQPTQEIK